MVFHKKILTQELNYSNVYRKVVISLLIMNQNQ